MAGSGFRFCCKKFYVHHAGGTGYFQQTSLTSLRFTAKTAKFSQRKAQRKNILCAPLRVFLCVLCGKNKKPTIIKIIKNPRSIVPSSTIQHVDNLIKR